MLRKLMYKNMGTSNLEWLRSIFHFSFAEYYNPENINFGVLRVINDDLIKSGTGFDTHPHRDMEIISYVIDGYLTHGDSMGNKRTIGRGQVQYMSAGTGVFHSEHNLGEQEARLLQIWIKPDAEGHTPQYGDYEFDWKDRKNRWLQIVSDLNGDGPVKIHQDANIYVTEIDRGESLVFEVEEDRQAYMILIEGEASVNEISLEARDAIEIIEETVTVKADEKAHLLVIEMKKG